ncbi:MAG: holo-ACP synthase [Deltaproteobacteria bacterium]|nr:holo-ACP synthase [Deltaproteobacteria bacterium]
MKNNDIELKTGIDIVYIPRITKILNSKEKDLFLKRCFANDEIEEFFRRKRRGAEFLAGRFALKESLLKILDDRRGVRLSEISCLSRGGRPVLKFRGKTMSAFKNYNLAISISHDNEYAIAVVFARRKR